jgi:hypothetical protein
MESIADWWRTFWDHTEFWNAFWPACIGALAGAIVATSLTRLYRKRERIDREVGECNKLLFIVGRMMSALADINADLFERPRKKLGREPTWSDIGALEGAPDEGPDFIIGEYTFLLEDDDPKSLAPQMLARVYTAEANFKAIIVRLHQRNQLWHEYNELRAPGRVARGEAGMPAVAATYAHTARIKELTEWLAEDLPESIKCFEKLLPELRVTLTKRYPKRRFIRHWSNADPTAPPL